MYYIDLLHTLQYHHRRRRRRRQCLVDVAIALMSQLGVSLEKIKISKIALLKYILK